MHHTPNTLYIYDAEHNRNINEFASTKIKYEIKYEINIDQKVNKAFEETQWISSLGKRNFEIRNEVESVNHNTVFSDFEKTKSIYNTIIEEHYISNYLVEKSRKFGNIIQQKTLENIISNVNKTFECNENEQNFNDIFSQILRGTEQEENVGYENIGLISSSFTFKLQNLLFTNELSKSEKFKEYREYLGYFAGIDWFTCKNLFSHKNTHILIFPSECLLTEMKIQNTLGQFTKFHHSFAFIDGSYNGFSIRTFHSPNQPSYPITRFENDLIIDVSKDSGKIFSVEEV